MKHKKVRSGQWFPGRYMKLKSIMKLQTLKEIRYCLPKGKTPFLYFKDGYAFSLLAQVEGDGSRVSDLKKTDFSQLLEKPAVKQALACYGGNKIKREDLLNHWQEPCEPFLLGLSMWGGPKYWRYNQLSRKGVNLVLQLNFCNKHQAQYYRLVKPKYDAFLSYSDHPIAKRKRKQFYRDTLAWARIDLEFDTGEALIEEIQSDWIRGVDWYLKPYLKARYPEKCWQREDIDGRINDIKHYVEQVLKPYRSIWAEAMLTAAIRFIREELGIRDIFYHTNESGAALKRISDSKPPKSIYSQLPRKFCFQSTSQAPAFLLAKRKHKRDITKHDWYRLTL